MKKFFTLLVLAACCAAMTWGCSDDKYDDTEIRQEIENLKQEIASMTVRFICKPNQAKRLPQATRCASRHRSPSPTAKAPAHSS